MKKILVIEDDAMIARIYSTKYAAAGFETRIALDGEQGLEFLASFQPDLIHLDLQVPKVNGAEIIRHIRAQPALQALPIIVLTNTYQNRLVRAALDAGANECVSKATCTPKMMVDLVEKFLHPPSEERPTTNAPSSAPPLSPPTAPSIAPPQAAPLVPPAAPMKAQSPLAPLSKAVDSRNDGSLDPAATYTQETVRHFESHDEIRRDFLTRAPRLLSSINGRLQPLLRAPNETRRVQELTALCGFVRSLGGHAGLAGFQELSQMAGALEALLLEILDKPSELTPSCRHTIIDACELLSALFDQSTTTRPDFAPTGVVLAVDPDAASRQALCQALGKLGVPTIGVAGSEDALRLLADNVFSLIFIEVDMPGMNGFEICSQLRALPPNQTTPVVFTTRLADFESRERSVASGANDLIAKPFLAMEVAVKALTLFRRRSVDTRVTAGHARSWPRRIHSPKTGAISARRSPTPAAQAAPPAPSETPATVSAVH